MLLEPARDESGDGVLELVNWVMSCRVFGRQLEEEALNILAETARARGVSGIRAAFVPTERNGVIADLFPRLGFAPAGEGRWTLSLAAHAARSHPHSPQGGRVTDPEILGTLTGILRDLLGDPDIVLDLATTRPEVPRWDSFAYVSFIVAVEVEYGIQLPDRRRGGLPDRRRHRQRHQEAQGRVNAVQFVRVHPGIPAGHGDRLPRCSGAARDRWRSAG